MEQTALLVIDMQNGFLHPTSPLFLDGAPATMPACARVIECCRERGIPVILKDCTSSKTDEIQRSNLRDMKNIGAAILNSSECMEELRNGGSV